MSATRCGVRGRACGRGGMCRRSSRSICTGDARGIGRSMGGRDRVSWSWAMSCSRGVSR
jgi:hypothetical protein